MKISISKLNKAHNDFKVIVSLGFYLFVFLILFYSTLNAGSLSGTSGLSYAAYHNVFRSGQQARGMVRMANGFTILTPSSGTGSTHGSIAYLETSLSVSGGIDLRTTNTMFLKTDLNLESNTTFSPYGGKIYGYDRSLILNGDLYIPDDSIFHIGGRIIIDGNGNTLNIGNSSKFLIDADATLTLRNLIIKNIQNQPGNPCLQCSTFDSKLCLDNVILSLTDDFYFNCGQLFIHNDVAVTGTSAFIYQSTNPSFIAPKSALYFHPETTFDFRPATTGTSTLLAKDLLFMQDATSQFYLNGCTLKTTATGLRLSKGQLIFDNKVSLTSNSQLYLTEFYNSGNPVATSDSYGNTITNISWSPNGKYLVIGGSTTNTIKIYQFNGSTLTFITSADYGSSIRALTWNPDSTHIAVGGTPGTINIYRFSQNSLTLISQYSYGYTIRCLSWNPDGRYLAAATDLQSLLIFSFTGGTSLLRIAVQTSYGGAVQTVSWSPDGKYIAIGGSTTQKLYIYSFSGSSLTFVAQSADYGGQINASCWSPDGRFVAIGGGSTNALYVYHFTGAKLILIKTVDYGGTIQTDSISWSYDGKYIAIGGGTTQKVNIYHFTGQDLFLVAQSADYGATISSLSIWNPNGVYIAAAGDAYTLNIYAVRYATPSTQTLSNSIVFGNSALGTTYDVNLTGLAEAQIEIDGLMNYDCAT